MGDDVAQLVEQQIATPHMQVGFPGAARDFLPRVNFQCRLFLGVRTPHVQLRALTSVCLLLILWSMSEFGGLWQHTHAQHAR